MEWRERLAFLARAMSLALDELEDLPKRLHFDGQFRRVNAYRIAELPSDKHLVEREYMAIHATGHVLCSYPESPPIPFHTEAAAEYLQQAILHPLRHLAGLARFVATSEALPAAAAASKGAVFFDSKAVSVAEGAADSSAFRCKVVFENGAVVRCRAIVVATHLPFGLWLSVHPHPLPYEYNVIVVRVGACLPAMIYDDVEDPYHYVRPWGADGDNFLVTPLGADHWVGSRTDTDGCFEELESYARSHLEVLGVVRRWSGMYFESPDSVPLDGHGVGCSAIHVACGFSENGVLQGTLAAMVLAEQISPISVLESTATVHILRQAGDIMLPSRVTPSASWKNMLVESWGNAKGLPLRRFPLPSDFGSHSAADLQPDSGAVLSPEVSPSMPSFEIGPAWCTHFRRSARMWDASFSTTMPSIALTVPAMDLALQGTIGVCCLALLSAAWFRSTLSGRGDVCLRFIIAGSASQA